MAADNKAAEEAAARREAASAAISTASAEKARLDAQRQENAKLKQDEKLSKQGAAKQKLYVGGGARALTVSQIMSAK